MSPLRRLSDYIFRYRRRFALGLLCVVLTQAVALTAPWVQKYAIDDLTTGVTARKLLVYGVLLLAIAIVGGVFRFLMRRILTGVSRHIEYDMRNDFFAHLEKLPQAYFQAHRTGDLMSRATNDLNAVRMMVGPAIMYSTSTLLGFVVSLAVMISIDARLAVWALLPLPFVSISVKYFGSAIHHRFEQIQAQLSDVSAVTQEALAGVRVVRAYRQESAELERFRRSNAEYLQRNRGLITLQGFFFPSLSFFLGFAAMLVLWLGSREVIQGRITLGQFVAFNLYLTMLSWPMIAFGWVTNMLQRGMASWKRMLEVLDTVPAIADFPEVGRLTASAPLALRRVSPELASQISERRRKPDTTYLLGDRPTGDHREIRGAIEFRDLTFSYNGTPVLDRVSARIEAGQTVALVGPTGSGKSTLINLLPRLHDPPPGTVFIDGVDVREIPLAALRRSIGFVPQEPFLFSDTLADNIAFGLDAIDSTGMAAKGQDTQAWPIGHERRERRETQKQALQRKEQEGPETEQRLERIKAAAAVARLDKDIVEFPKGYDTIVGERGITLSGGQKQRTAIARAIVIDPRILILDDALSAVDTYTEEEILLQLKSVMRQRTSLIVSHRISTVREADLILVIDVGRIVERGTHDELVRRSGLYAELHRKQLLEEELAAS